MTRAVARIDRVRGGAWPGCVPHAEGSGVAATTPQTGLGRKSWSCRGPSGCQRRLPSSKARKSRRTTCCEPELSFREPISAKGDRLARNPSMESASAVCWPWRSASARCTSCAANATPIKLWVRRLVASPALSSNAGSARRLMAAWALAVKSASPMEFPYSTSSGTWFVLTRSTSVATRSGLAPEKPRA